MIQDVKTDRRVDEDRWPLVMIALAVVAPFALVLALAVMRAAAS